MRVDNMINKLKSILNSYENFDGIELWVNSKDEIEAIIVDETSINLITNAEIKVNGSIEKEGFFTNNKLKVKKAIEYIESNDDYSFSKSELLEILKGK